MTYPNFKQRQTRAVADAISAKDFAKAMSLRDPEFCESLEGFISTSELTQEKQLPKPQVCFRQTISGAYPLIFNSSECASRSCSKSSSTISIQMNH
jgi:hypothetical protein